MIDLKELRIGNWVNADFHPDEDKIELHLRQISVIGADYVLCNHPEGNYYRANKYLFPIPLTVEIIEECGFDFNNETKMRSAWCDENEWFSEFVYDDGSFRNPSIVYKPTAAPEYQFQYSNVYIQYFHEFQNLYFAITKEELPYKP